MYKCKYHQDLHILMRKAYSLIYTPELCIPTHLCVYTGGR